MTSRGPAYSSFGCRGSSQAGQGVKQDGRIGQPRRLTSNPPVYRTIEASDYDIYNRDYSSTNSVANRHHSATIIDEDEDGEEDDGDNSASVTASSFNGGVGARRRSGNRSFHGNTTGCYGNNDVDDDDATLVTNRKVRNSRSHSGTLNNRTVVKRPAPKDYAIDYALPPPPPKTVQRMMQDANESSMSHKQRMMQDANESSMSHTVPPVDPDTPTVSISLSYSHGILIFNKYYYILMFEIFL